MFNALKRKFDMGFTVKETGTSPLTLKGSLGKKLSGYDIYGQSEQDGTPSPSSPVAIESCGDKTENLFDKNNVNWLKGSQTYSYIVGTTGEITNASAVNYEVNRTFYISIKPSTAYTIVFGNTTYTKRIGTYVTTTVGSTTTNYQNAITANSATITSGATDNYLVVQLYTDTNYTAGARAADIIPSVMIVEGSTVPSTYIPYGYKIPVVMSGKNLIPYPYYDSDTKTINGITYTVNQDGSINVTGTSTATAYYYLSNSSLTIEKDSIISVNGLVANIGVVYTASEGTYYLSTSTTSRSISAGTTLTTLRLYVSGADKTVDVSSIKIQIELGTTTTSYEPYQAPTTTNIYLDEPLRKVGDLKDSIDYATGKATRNNAEIASYNGETITTSYISSTGSLTTGAQVVYQLATPTEETITLPTISTETGTNYIQVATDVAPSSMSVVYRSRVKQ